MSEANDYEITRRAAAAVTRRHSFLMMGGVAAGRRDAAARPRPAKRARRPGNGASANAASAGQAWRNPAQASPTCLDHLLPCCDPLATCNARESTECLLRPLPN